MTTLFKTIAQFFARRFMLLARIVIGVFMLLMGLWFMLAPITQQFLSKQASLQDAPFIWLIVPLGIVQIAIGISILRPLFK